MSVKTRLGRWSINIVRKPSLRSGVTTRHGIAAVGKITSVEFLQISVVNQSSLGTSQQMPRSASVSLSPGRQSITFECTEFNNQKHSGRYPRRRDRPLFFNIHQWERQTASIKRQRSTPSILTASLHQWELFIHHSIIHFNHEVYHAMRKLVLGTWVDTWTWR